MLVEASILARLLGIRLLKIDATVLVSPARVPEGRVAGGPRRGRLADAVRSLHEGAELLQAARSD